MADKQIGEEFSDWDKYFQDQKLKELIQLALKNNRDIRKVIQNIEAARAVYGIQKSEQLPSIGLGANVTRSLTPEDLSLTQKATHQTVYQVNLGISSWEIDFWGRIRNLKEAALEKYLASLEAKKAAQLSLISQVANSYLLQREIEERLQIALKTIEIREKGKKISEQRFAVGSTSKVEVNQTTILYYQAKSEANSLTRMKTQNINALHFLVGTKFIDNSNLLLSDVENYFTKEIPVALPSELLTRRPDIIASEHLLKSANAQIGAARAAYFPNISLTAVFGQGSVELNQLFDNPNRAWSLGSTINLPIFTAGKISSNVELTKAQKEAALNDYEKTIQNAFKEVSDVLADRLWAREQLEIQKGMLAAQTERADIAKKRYEKGSAAYLEILDSERERFSAEQALVQIRRTYMASAINLFVSLGGNFLENNQTK
jgi:multidrug efflux system outer membrane protein